MKTTAHQPDVSFIVPGNNRSGGVRVTVCMANRLLARGYRVRILYPRVRRFSKQWWRIQAIRFRRSHLDGRNMGWLHEFKGPVTPFGDINALPFAEDEIVISVGTLTIPHLEVLNANVQKLRYNHGLLTGMTSEEIRRWSLPLPTITVSKTLIPELEAMSGQPVLAVVPNGIDTSEYYPQDNIDRNAIGTIYSSHVAKAPELLPELMGQIHRRWPMIPQIVFGTEERPNGFQQVEYHRLPSVEEARVLYNRARIWLLASHTEGFPGPLLEAMACRCLVISTDTYGGREIIRHGENGLLVPRGDIAAFLEQIEAVLSDSVLFEKLALGGLNTARGLTWDAAADQMETAMEQLTNRGTLLPGSLNGR